MTVQQAGVAALLMMIALPGVSALDDVTDFSVTTNAPADVENVFCGFVAATNAVKHWCEPLEWPKLTLEQKAALAAENAEALALFAEACRRPQWYQSDARQEGAFQMFPIAEFMRMIKLQEARANALIERGEIGAAVDCFDELLAIARTIQTDAETIVCWLVADSARGMACDLAARIVESGRATAADLRRLLDGLSGFDEAARRRGLRQMVNNEYRYNFENGLRIFEAEQLKSRTGVLAQLYFNLIYKPVRTRKIYRDWLVKVKAALSDDYDKAAGEMLTAEFDKATAVPESRLRRLVPSNGLGRTLLGALAVSYERIAVSVAHGDYQRRATAVVVAATLCKRKNGDFPDSLEALVPEFLPSVPKDPFGHGAALQYDKARGIVWTVGPEGDFNGEKLPGTDTYGRNFKYVMNLDGTSTYQPKGRTPGMCNYPVSNIQ